MPPQGAQVIGIEMGALNIWFSASILKASDLTLLNLDQWGQRLPRLR
jgi:hypothetical protein